MTDGGPETIGRYRVLRELGQGIMGVVYEAEDPLLGRRVALKTIHRALSSDPATGEMFEKRFFAEAKAAASLSHPGIVVVHDLGRDDSGRLFIALEHLSGQTLESQLAGGRALPWEVALRVAGGVAEALHHAHSRGIIHRDVKPANVMILEAGAPKILDFGIARLPASQLTTGGSTFGSPSYMAPERMDGKTPDPRADVFSLGAVLYEMLTGQKAFGGKDLDDRAQGLLRGAGPALGAAARVAERGRPHRRAGDGERSRARYPTALAFGEDVNEAAAGRPLRHQRRAPRRGGGRPLRPVRRRRPRIRATERSGRAPRRAWPCPPANVCRSRFSRGRGRASASRSRGPRW